MGWKWLHTIDKEASANDVYEKTLTEIYELDSIDDYNKFLFRVRKKNTMFVETTENDDFRVYWVITSSSISKRPPMPAGRVQVEVTLQLRALRNGNELLAPWELPAFNFTISGSTSEETVSDFYPEDGDLWLNGDDYYSYPLVNSAGVPLEATNTFATAQISYSYAIALGTFDKIYSMFWSLPGKINSDGFWMCGMYFPPRTIKLDSLNAEYCETQAPGRALVGFKKRGNAIIYEDRIYDTLYKYYRVDATFTANPRTWNQNFLNVGTHVRRNGSILRLWNWADPATGRPMWGTYMDYRMAGGQNGEQVSEPVPLNAAGTNVSNLLSDGRLEMTYRYGSVYEPVPFGELGFPAAYPAKWAAGN